MDENSSDSFFNDLRIEIKKTAQDCEFYKNLCEEKDYNFDQTVKESNLEEIPFVNWNYFKESNGTFDQLLRIPLEELSHWTLSSSTSGDPSVVGRGPKDIEVFKKNYTDVFEDFSNMKSIERLILFAPSIAFMNRMPGEWLGKRGYLFYRDIAEIWEDYDIDYLLEFKKLKFILYFITHFKPKAFIEINAKKLKKSLREVEENKTPTLIANSVPLMYKNFMDYKKKYKKGFDMDESFRVQLGGGGWQGVKGRVKLDNPIEKSEFMEKVSDFFNIPYGNIVDNYGATEIPVACGGHWSEKYQDFLFHLEKEKAYMILRDMDTLERINRVNEPGVVEFITPYGVNSYAGVLVLLDDIIEIVDFNKCEECGREGIIFRIIGRMTPEIGKGCSSFTNLYPFR